MVARSVQAFLKVENLPVQGAEDLERVLHSLGGQCFCSRVSKGSDTERGQAVLVIHRDQVGAILDELKKRGIAAGVTLQGIHHAVEDDRRSGHPFRVGNRTYCRTARPFLMGILNVTPDSFSDGGQFLEAESALKQARRMADQGADFIDVGGESSRPGADPVSEEEELRRVVPLIERLSVELNIPISIDTTKAGVARVALEAGAAIVNDISALRWDVDMASVVADAGASVVLMHMKGEPRTMQMNPHYDDLMSEIHEFLADRCQMAQRSGIPRERILVDPGIGFGKRLGDNLELLGRLEEFRDLGAVLVGPSKKSFIGQILDLPVEERDWGTAAAVAVASWNGADVIRVHDVAQMFQVAQIVARCRQETGSEDYVNLCESTN